MEKPYSSEKLKYLFRFVGISYEDVGKMLSYSRGMVGTIFYQIDNELCTEERSFRIRLLMTYMIQDYIRSKFGDLELLRILRETDHHLEMKAKESKHEETV